MTPETETDIALLIFRSRRDDEGFMVDEALAAKNVLEYLLREGLLLEPEIKLKVA